MKKKLLAVIYTFISVLVMGQNHVIITRNCDPNDNYDPDRYSEIYNAGDQAVDITGWTLENIQNNSVAFSWTFSGSIAPGETWVCARLKDTIQTIDPDVTTIWQGSSWNGKDGDGTILRNAAGDTLDFAVQSGSTNTFENKQMKRKLTVTESNSSFNADEWVFTTIDSANDLLPGVRATVWRGVYSNWGTSSSWDCEIPTATTDAYIFKSGDTTQINIDAEVRNLFIESEAVVIVQAGESLSVYGDLNNNGGENSLLLDADASSLSSLIHYSENVQATVKSYFNDIGNGQWYLISSPVSNATAGIFNGEYLDYWSEPNASWIAIEDENNVFSVGQGYSLQRTLSDTVTYKGLLNSGEIVINLDYTNQSMSFGDGWNLIGNPYASLLDIDQIDFGSNVVATAYVYPHGNANAYISWSQGGGGNTEARYIQPGQGFMVQATASGQSILLTDNMRTHTDVDSFDKGNKSTNQLNGQLKIELTGFNNRKDESYINFNENATLSFDHHYDAHKFSGSGIQPYVFSYIDLSENEKAAINSIPFPEEGDIINLGTEIGLNGEYNLSFSGLHSFGNQFEFFLLDKKLNQLLDLEMDSVYGFIHESNDAINRFDLILGLSTAIAKKDVNQEFNCFVNQENIQIILNSQLSKKYNLSIYNVLGQEVYHESFYQNTFQFKNDFERGTYIFALQSGDCILAKKVFLP